jgi:RNA recognition motif-containing protein
MRKDQRPRRQVFIGSISYDATETDVAEVLKQEGFGIFKVSMPLSDDGQSKGYAFVDLSHDEMRSPKEVIEEINGMNLLIFGRRIRAGEVKDRGKGKKGKKGQSRGRVQNETGSLRNEFTNDNEFDWR